MTSPQPERLAGEPNNKRRLTPVETKDRFAQGQKTLDGYVDKYLIGTRRSLKRAYLIGGARRAIGAGVAATERGRAPEKKASGMWRAEF